MVHWTLNRPRRKLPPLFHPPVPLMSPSAPKIYDEGCMSDRGVIARRRMMIRKVAPKLMNINELANQARCRVLREFSVPWVTRSPMVNPTTFPGLIENPPLVDIDTAASIMLASPNSVDDRPTI